MWEKKKSKGETQVGADQEKKSRLILQFAARQDLVPTRGSKNGGRGGLFGVYQPSSPCYTSSDALSHSNKSMYLCSAKVLAARRLDRSVLALRSDHGWDLRTYTTGYWDPGRDKLYQCIPETLQPARHTITPAQSTLGAHTYEMRLHVNNLQLFTARNKAISKARNSFICPADVRFL